MKSVSFLPKKSVYFGLKNNKNIKKKDMNWEQAKNKYPRLKPYGDTDKDGVPNISDCRPFNKKKHIISQRQNLPFKDEFLPSHNREFKRVMGKVKDTSAQDFAEEVVQSRDDY